MKYFMFLLILQLLHYFQYYCEKFLRDEGKSDVLLQLSLSVRNDLLAYKLMIYSVLSRIETFWVCTALAFCAAHSMLLFSIPSHP